MQTPLFSNPSSLCRFANSLGRNQNTERSPQNERADIHDAGRLQTAQFGAAGTAGSADGTVLPNEGEVPEREPQGAVLQSPDELQAERASDADRTDGDRNGGTPDERDGGEGRLDREPESDGYTNYFFNINSHNIPYLSFCN